MKLKPGQIVDAKYRLLSLLGEGGMGVVFAAEHVELKERRAIKIMRLGLLGDKEQTERFHREARSAARLKSAHVCKVLDVGKVEDGSPYLVMEHLEGRDLKVTLKQQRMLPIAEAVRYTMEACDGLGEAHRLGIVHRDLKPGNLFLAQTAGGQTSLKILDFGVAKVDAQDDDGDGESDQLTQVAQMLGTPEYMAPEQMSSAKDVDGRADIWSLGVILYRMLTSEMPFQGEDQLDIITGVMSEPPVPPAQRRREIPAALEAAVLRCLEKNPAKRFATAEELSAALAPFRAIRPLQGPLEPDSDGSDECATMVFAPGLKMPVLGGKQMPASAFTPILEGGGTIPIPRDLLASLNVSPLPAPPAPAAPAAPAPVPAAAPQQARAYPPTLALDMAPMPEPSAPPQVAAPHAWQGPPPTSSVPSFPDPGLQAPRGASTGLRFLVGLLVSLAVFGAPFLYWWFFRRAR